MAQHDEQQHEHEQAQDGQQVLGLDVGDSEDETLWRAFLLSLKQRGLAGVRLSPISTPDSWPR